MPFSRWWGVKIVNRQRGAPAPIKTCFTFMEYEHNEQDWFQPLSHRGSRLLSLFIPQLYVCQTNIASMPTHLVLRWQATPVTHITASSLVAHVVAVDVILPSVFVCACQRQQLQAGRRRAFLVGYGQPMGIGVFGGLLSCRKRLWKGILLGRFL